MIRRERTRATGTSARISITRASRSRSASGRSWSNSRGSASAGAGRASVSPVARSSSVSGPAGVAQRQAIGVQATVERVVERRVEHVEGPERSVRCVWPSKARA